MKLIQHFMKRLIAVFLFAAMLLALAACGGGASDGESTLTAGETGADSSGTETPPTGAPEPATEPAPQKASVGGVSVVVPGDYRHDEESPNRAFYVSPSAKVQISLILFWQSLDDFVSEMGCGSASDVIRKIAAEKSAAVESVEMTELDGRTAAKGCYSGDTFGKEYLYLIALEDARVHVVVHISPDADGSDVSAAMAAMETISVQ